MVGPDDGWAVGDGGTILHWDGEAWTQLASPTDSHLFSVAMVGSDDGWAVGGLYHPEEYTILHWDGEAWTEVASPTDRYLFSVDMVSSDDGWAVGSYSSVLHWDGDASIGMNC